MWASQSLALCPFQPLPKLKINLRDTEAQYINAKIQVNKIRDAIALKSWVPCFAWRRGTAMGQNRSRGR